MKALIIPAVAVALCCNTADVVAQTKSKTKKPATSSRTEETIVIKKDGNGANTTVEIKNGDVYINGEKVANTNNSNSSQKIIIENGDVSPMHAMPFALDREDIPRKAMLGIYTNVNKDHDGAEIRDVMPGSAADEAGLKAGDVITKINDKPIADGKALTMLIAKQEPGDKVNISYERNGKEKQTVAALSKAAPQTMARSYQFGPNGNEFEIPNPMVRPFTFDAGDGLWEPSPKMGVQVEDLVDGKGVRVLSVKPNSPADEAGIKKNDIIKKLDDEKIVSVDDLQAILRGVKRNESVKVQYQRDGESSSTEIYFPKATKKKNL